MIVQNGSKCLMMVKNEGSNWFKIALKDFQPSKLTISIPVADYESFIQFLTFTKILYDFKTFLANKKQLFLIQFESLYTI